MFWEWSVIHNKVSVFEISPCTPITSRGQWAGHPILFFVSKAYPLYGWNRSIFQACDYFITFKKYWRQHHFLNVHHVREKTSLQIAKTDIFNRFLFKGLVSASHFQGKKKCWWRLEVRKEILSINGNLNILAIKLTVYSRYLSRFSASSSAPASSYHTGTSFSTIFKVNFHLLVTRFAGYFGMRLK